MILSVRNYLQPISDSVRSSCRTAWWRKTQKQLKGIADIFNNKPAKKGSFQQDSLLHLRPTELENKTPGRRYGCDYQSWLIKVTLMFTSIIRLASTQTDGVVTVFRIIQETQQHTRHAQASRLDIYPIRRLMLKNQGIWYGVGFDPLAQDELSYGLKIIIVRDKAGTFKLDSPSVFSIKNHDTLLEW